MKYFQLFGVFIYLIMAQHAVAQQSGEWNGKSCAVVLTYDDALNVHLDNVIPCLDSAGFKGTFYIVVESQVLSKRMQEWRLAAAHGHELGNHTLNHPCNSAMPGRSWVSSEADLSKYTVARAEKEIRVTNTLLTAIDGKTERTFAYPCGDLNIDTLNYYTSLEKEFTAARGTDAGLESIDKVDLNNIRCYAMNGNSGDDMVKLVKSAMESHTLLVFLFHGVGGEHNINVSAGAHSLLIKYLKKNEKDIWVATLDEVGKYIRANRNSGK